MTEKLNPTSKKHMVRFGIYMVIYVFAIMGMSALRGQYTDTIYIWPIAFMPVVPCFLALLESYWGVMAMDEMMRRVHLEGVFISAFATGFVTFTWGMLSNAGVEPFELALVLPMLIGFWGIGTALRKRAYE